MRFDRLLWHALIAGKSSFTDGPDARPLGVRLTAQAGETVLFFRSDLERFREGQQGVPLCDLLVLVRREQDLPRVMLVEMKGRDVPHAFEQLKETHARVAAALAEDCPLGRGQLIPVIVRHGAAPAANRADQKKFAVAGVPVRFASGPKCDLRPLLGGLVDRAA